jgi:hypothetical protein
MPLSETSLATGGARGHYYRAVFLAAALWNAMSGAAVLFVLTNGEFRERLGLPGPPDKISLQLLALCLLVFGLGYYWVSRNLSRNRDLVKMGVIGKPFVFLVFFGHALAQEIPWVLTLPSLVDLLFGMLFLEFLVRTRQDAVT